jgi:hypothetical protein
MSKKEGDRTICRNKINKFKSFNKSAHTRNQGFLGVLPNRSAQITVFMIVGLVLLFIFLLLIQLTSSITKENLEIEKEKVVTKAFEKEALRIYVEDCLNDELERGLILLGQQGRIWSDQPGGTKKFADGISGINYQPDNNIERISYGIAQEKYLTYPNAYPCEDDIHNSEFCKYQYPNISIGFGELVIKTDSVLVNDLRKFLINRTVWCVANFTKTNISSKAELKPTKINLKLDITNDGINVNAEYPMKFSIGKEEFFHLSTFDFFYPTQFRGLLESAVVRPLFYDWKFVDFNYTNETLKSPYFNYGSKSEKCLPFKNNFFCDMPLAFEKYKSLAVDMTIEELNNGDDLFIFKSPEILNLPGLYEFKFVRQNRPPALDYVNRTECIVEDNPDKSYDYLVIIGDEKYGDVDIKLNAFDADEDEVKYRFILDGEPPQEKQNHYESNDSVKQQFTADFKKLIVEAEDEHGLKDWQEVRILLERPVDLGLSLRTEYQVRDANGVLVPHESVDNKFITSNEDPVFITVKFPEDSLIGATPIIYFNYSSTVGESFDFKLPSGTYPLIAGTEICYNFPHKDNSVEPCKLDLFKNEIDMWPDKLLDDTFSQAYFKSTTLPGSPGKLNLSLSIDYCSDRITDSTKVDLTVAQCIPHVNPQHPYPYMPDDPDNFYLYEFELDATSGEIDESIPAAINSINPFLATHQCCNSINWKVFDTGHPCFENPNRGCYGKIKDYTALSGYGGYVLEKETRYCDGTRGNICAGEKVYQLWDDELRCGNNGAFEDCNNIHSDCQDLLAFSLIEDKGWCSGKMGCEKLCDDPLVSLNQGEQVYSESLNSIAKVNQLTSGIDMDLISGQPVIGVVCSCGKNPVAAKFLKGYPCDKQWDGIFEGICNNGICEDLTCPPGDFFCSGNDVHLCDNSGINSILEKECGAKNCVDGQCVESTSFICEPYKVYCYNDIPDPAYKELIDKGIILIKEQIASGEITEPDIINFNWDLFTLVTKFICSPNGETYSDERCPLGQECSSGSCIDGMGGTG